MLYEKHQFGLGEESATSSLDLIAFGGHIAYINDAPDFTAVEPFTKVISFHEVALNAAHQYGDYRAQKDLAIIGDHMLKMVSEKKLSPMLERVIKLEEVSKTLVELSQRQVKGKIIVKINKNKYFWRYSNVKIIV